MCGRRRMTAMKNTIKNIVCRMPRYSFFHHALKNYHGFDEYDVYEEFDYPDWDVPYTQILTQGKTKVIYNGVPIGKYQHYVINALYQSIDSILVQAK